MTMNRNNYKRLGDYVRLVDVRNRDLAVTNLLGVSISKMFIPSIANTIGTDMSTYKIVEPYQFAYGPVTSRNGDKITFALYKGAEKCIISSAYITFEVIDKEKLDPDYLMMWALRPEFDRYARFMSNGSAREIFSWDDMCEVYLPIPDINEQRRIVAEYQAVEKRIATNEALIAQLEETAQIIYKKTFIDDINLNDLPSGWSITTLDDLSEFIAAGTIPEYVEESKYLVLGQKCVANHKISLDKARPHSPKPTCKFVQYGDILINSTGDGTLGRVGQIDFEPHTLAYDSNMTLVRPKEKYLISYLFEFMKTQEDHFVNISQGSTNQTRLYCSMIRPLEVLRPTKCVLEDFQRKMDMLYSEARLLSKELPIMRELLKLQQSRLSQLV